MLRLGGADFLAKIAAGKRTATLDSIHDEVCRPPRARVLATGNGWTVRDVVCTAGPDTPVFEEQHSQTSIAVVLSGTFRYRTSTGHELMTPGSLLLGNAGDYFVCGHEHGTGDRCISFHYSGELCDQFGAESRLQFKIPRVPALRFLSPLIAEASRLLGNDLDSAVFQEMTFQVLDFAMHAQHGLAARPHNPDQSSLARVTRVLRTIEAEPEASHELYEMAAIAGLSPYHFLRCFQQLTGTTPHQYLLRTRLRRAAIRLREESTNILEIALDCGFGDVSNFNRTFRAEFGDSPRSYRRAGQTCGASRHRRLP
jgi:AraC family transcriptional regulator